MSSAVATLVVEADDDLPIILFFFFPPPAAAAAAAAASAAARLVWMRFQKRSALRFCFLTASPSVFRMVRAAFAFRMPSEMGLRPANGLFAPPLLLAPLMYDENENDEDREDDEDDEDDVVVEKRRNSDFF